MNRPVTLFTKNLKTLDDNKMNIWVMEPIGKGTFHCFSIAYHEFENGIGNYPVAIIEKPDGSVVIFDANLIKFDDVQPVIT